MIRKGTKAWYYYNRLPGISMKTARKCAEFERRGYKIKYTVDSGFLFRNPMNRRDMRRVGELLGTGATGKQGHSVFAYKEVRIR